MSNGLAHSVWLSHFSPFRSVLEHLVLAIVPLIVSRTRLSFSSAKTFSVLSLYHQCTWEVLSCLDGLLSLLCPLKGSPLLPWTFKWLNCQESVSL